MSGEVREQTDLAGWLLEQVAEDERGAHASGPALVGWATYRADDGAMRYTSPVASDDGERWATAGSETDPTSVRVVFDPARVLAECDAKRRVIELHQQAEPPYIWLCTICGETGQNMDCTYPCDTLRLMALPYVDRSGYRADEWGI